MKLTSTYCENCTQTTTTVKDAFIQDETGNNIFNPKYRSSPTVKCGACAGTGYVIPNELTCGVCKGIGRIQSSASTPKSTGSTGGTE